MRGGYGGRGGGYGGHNIMNQFTNWNYGYTLGPPQEQGGYHQFHRAPGPRGGGFGGGRGGGRGFGGGRPPFRGGGGGGSYNQGPSASSQDTVKKEPGTETVKQEPGTEPVKIEPGKDIKKEPDMEEGQIADDKPLNEILRGKNPIVWCNEQSKYRSLKMDWEQISETGPPHDKTFTWSLKMGETMTVGVANTKKGAKQKAAEEMARKLDAQKSGFSTSSSSSSSAAAGGPRKRPAPSSSSSSSDFGAHSSGGNNAFQLVQQSLKKARMRSKNEQAIAANREASHPRSAAHAPIDKTAQNNPISKLYEHCRRQHWPEPTFETISENVLDQYKTQQGFMLKKTEFTIQCEIQGKKFIGNALTKKEAKYNAATNAWAEFGAGVKQSSISNMLQAQRDGAK